MERLSLFIEHSKLVLEKPGVFGTWAEIGSAAPGQRSYEVRDRARALLI
jgi:hypothetical protein